jgi:tetratricopeptide (TPR) repeat protein
MRENSPEIQAVLDLQRAGKTEEARAALDTLVSKDPNNGEAVHVQGIMAYQARNYEDALKYMEKSITLDPKPSYYSNLGNVYGDLRQFTKAKAAYQNALRMDPSLAAVYGNIGNMYRAQNNPEQAIFQYLKGLRIDPKNVEIHLHMASLFFDLKRYPQAIENYQKVLEIAPKRLEALNNLGSIYHQQGQTEQAIVYYEQAIELAPDFVAGLFNLANLKREQRDLEGAKALYAQVQIHHPDLVEASLQLAQILDFEGDAEGAETLYKEVLARQPREEIVLLLADRAAQKNNLTEAMEYFQKAHEMNPNNPDTCYNMGTILKQQGDSNGAAYFLNQALQLQDYQTQN